MLRWHAGSWAVAPRCLPCMRLRLGWGWAPSGWSRWSAGGQSRLCRTAGPVLGTAVLVGIRKMLPCAAQVSGRAGTPCLGLGRELGKALHPLGPGVGPDLPRAGTFLWSAGDWCQLGSSLGGSGRPLATACGTLQPQGYPLACLCLPACLPEQRRWALSRPPFLALQEGQFGGDVSGASPDTHRVCWGGGSPGPAHPPSQPSSPLPPLQLHPGRQHSHPKQVTCPPPGAAYPWAQAVTHSWMEGAPCRGVKLPGGGTGRVVGG